MLGYHHKVACDVIAPASKADIHLKLRPGTNAAFANGMMHVMIKEGLIDQKFIEERTEGVVDKFEKAWGVPLSKTVGKRQQRC